MKHPWSGLSGLPRASWTLAAASLVNRAGTMVMPFLALYLTRELRFPIDHASALFAVYGIGALVGGPMAGRLADRFGAMRVLVASLAASGCVLLAFPFAKTELSVAVVVLLFAITAEGVRPATMTLAGALVLPELRKAAFSLNRLAVNLGMSIGPAVGGLLASIDFRLLFLVDGATSIAAAALLVATFPKTESAGASAASSVSTRSAFFDPRFVPFLVGVVFVGFVFFQLEAALPLYLVGTRGISERAFGLLFSINTVLILLVEVALNTATAHWPHARTLGVGALGVGVGFGGLALVRGVGSAAACIVAITFGEMMLFPAMSAFVADAAPEGRTGAYMGAYSMAFALAYAVAPALGSFLLDRFGGDVLWPATLGLSIVMAALLAIAAKTKST